MTLKRSLPYLSSDELVVTHAQAKYQHKILEEPITKPIKQFGLGGIDEALYKLRHSLVPGKARRKKETLEGQLELLENEARKRKQQGEFAPGEYASRLAQTAPNPATYNTLKQHKKRLRGHRLWEMRGEQRLDVTEKLSAYKARLSDAAEQAKKKLGRAGDAIQRNWMYGTAAVLMAGTAYFGHRWVQHDRIYQDVAAHYEISTDCAPNARAIKRDVVELGEGAVWDLTNWEEIVIETEDGDIVIPEGKAHPQLARRKLGDASDVVQQSLTGLETCSELTQHDKQRLREHRAHLQGQYESLDAQLSFRLDPQGNYVGEQAAIAGIHDDIQRPVEVFEQHMPSHVVEAENEAYSDMKRSKIFTYVLGGLSGVFLLSGLRNNRRRRLTDRYY